MYHKHHTKGVVLFGMSEGERNRRVGVLTDGLGLIWARAQSARSTQSKLRSGCQDYSLGDFSLVLGKSGWRVVSARTECNFYEIFKDNPQKTKTVANLFLLLRRLVTGEGGAGLYSITSNFLNFLILAKEEEVAPAEWLALCKILRTLGFLRDDPEVSPYLLVDDINERSLVMIAPMKNKIIQLINESLSVASVG